MRSMKAEWCRGIADRSLIMSQDPRSNPDPPCRSFADRKRRLLPHGASPNELQMIEPDPKPLPGDATAVDKREGYVAALERGAGARGDFAVVAELLPYLRPYLRRIVLALGLILGAKLANVLVPIALKKIVDHLGLEPGMRTLPIALLVAYGGARVGVTLFTELRQVVFARVMARASRQITLKVFRHLHGLS